MVHFLFLLVFFSTHQEPKGVWTAEWKPDGTMIVVTGDDSTLWLYQGTDLRLASTVKVGEAAYGPGLEPG